MYNEKSEALDTVCHAMFGQAQPIFPTVMWAACFPMEVILYALVEAELKRRRTPGIEVQQISNFAHTVMNRRYREEQKQRRMQTIEGKRVIQVGPAA
jgi:hypothetical protein